MCCLCLSTHSDPKVSTSILPNVLDMVGNTPLVRLDKIAKREGLECELRMLILGNVMLVCMYTVLTPPVYYQACQYHN